ncbi:MAG: tetratricopeptide repeat protein [Porticoccaceae bacterium]
MSADQPANSFKHVLATAREYLTHWFIAGVIVTLTGFAPDHWFAHLFHAANLDGFFEALPTIDYRLIVVGLGVLVSTVAVIFQMSRMQRPQSAIAPAFVASATAPLSVPAEDSDAIKDKPSIAVLPFVNMSDDKSQEYFADGMTEDIITGLSCDSRLFVIARNSTFAYKGQSPDIRAVGKELGVRYVLEGSIRPMGDRLRITVQLIDTTSGAHVWADKIDRPVAELFKVMDEVVDDLVTALCANLGVAESHRAQRARPEDLQAWALCVQAEVLYSTQRDFKALLEGEKLARRAAEIEPGYAISWALLGFMVSRRIPLGVSRDLAKDSQEALSLSARALGLAPNDPIVLGYCGSAAAFVGHATQGIDYLERSLAINPNSGFCRIYYGQALSAGGRPEDGIAELERFIRRSPKDPYVGVAYFFLAIGYLTNNNPQRAEQAARNAVKHQPGFAWGYVALALSQEALGRGGEARQQLPKVRELAPTVTGQYLEDMWRHLLRHSGQAETLVALTRKVWSD